MSKIEKLIAKLKTRPKDFEYAELRRVMEHFGYAETDGAGSRKRFVDKEGRAFTMHKPHPGPELLPYQVKEAAVYLERRKLI